MLLKNERSLKATKNKMSVLYFSLARKGSLGRARGEIPLKRNAKNFNIIDKYALEVNLEILDLVCKILGSSVKFGESGDFAARFY